MGQTGDPDAFVGMPPMNSDVFAAALGLSEPWFVAGLQFDEGERLLRVRVDFRRGSRFPHGV